MRLGVLGPWTYDTSRLDKSLPWISIKRGNFNRSCRFFFNGAIFFAVPHDGKNRDREQDFNGHTSPQMLKWAIICYELKNIYLCESF